jgi:hypothetical protein
MALIPGNRADPLVFESNIKTLITLHKGGTEKALRAAAIVVENEAKRNAKGGFKTGNFATNGWTSIGHDVVRKGLMGNLVARVGSTRLHFLFWEVGHFNIFTGGFEQNTWLSDAFRETEDLQQEAAATALRKHMRKSSIFAR